jgi:hypothetical protein
LSSLLADVGYRETRLGRQSDQPDHYHTVFSSDPS